MVTRTLTVDFVPSDISTGMSTSNASHSDPSPTVGSGSSVRQWTDDRIRWEGTDMENGRSCNVDEETPDDPFKDTDPTETFSFQFLVPRHPNRSDVNPLVPIDIVLSGYKAESDPIWQSTGLTLWKASQHMCEYMIRHRNELFLSEGTSVKRILELGAGLGLAGILAHKLLLLGKTSTETSSVCVTDGDSDVLIKLNENIFTNCEPFTRSTISSQQLLWGRETATEFLRQEKHEEEQLFDVILASDIIYAQCIIEPLWETIQTLLTHRSTTSPSGGVFLMAFAKRRVPVSIEYVLESAVKAGFAYTQCDDKNALADNVFIYEFRWNNESSVGVEQSALLCR